MAIYTQHSLARVKQEALKLKASLTAYPEPKKTNKKAHKDTVKLRDQKKKNSKLNFSVLETITF